mmetsp:Transcript_99611/g.213373  ORF Transcript_99611/g.213373 Transcript_99611/m.213373 type:complete len:239 (-) Transcript_99611:670-1386(-)
MASITESAVAPCFMVPHLFPCKLSTSTSLASTSLGSQVIAPRDGDVALPCGNTAEAAAAAATIPAATLLVSAMLISRCRSRRPCFSISWSIARLAVSIVLESQRVSAAKPAADIAAAMLMLTELPRLGEATKAPNMASSMAARGATRFLRPGEAPDVDPAAVGLGPPFRSNAPAATEAADGVCAAMRGATGVPMAMGLLAPAREVADGAPMVAVGVEIWISRRPAAAFRWRTRPPSLA